MEASPATSPSLTSPEVDRTSARLAAEPTSMSPDVEVSWARPSTRTARMSPAAECIRRSPATVPTEMSPLTDLARMSPLASSAVISPLTVLTRASPMDPLSSTSADAVATSTSPWRGMSMRTVTPLRRTNFIPCLWGTFTRMTESLPDGWFSTVAPSTSSSDPPEPASSVTSVVAASRAVITTKPTSFSTTTLTLPGVSNVRCMLILLFSARAVAVETRPHPATAVLGSRRAAIEHAQDPSVDGETLAGRPRFNLGLQLLGHAQRDARREIAVILGGRGVLVDVGELDVVTHQANLDPSLGQFRREFGGDIRKEIEDPAGRRTSQDGGDALRRLGHRFIAQLPPGLDIGPESLDDQRHLHSVTMTSW